MGYWGRDCTHLKVGSYHSTPAALPYVNTSTVLPNNLSQEKPVAMVHLTCQLDQAKDTQIAGRTLFGQCLSRRYFWKDQHLDHSG